MADEPGPRFLIGKGETLTETVVLAGAGRAKVPRYTFSEAKARLVEPLRKTSKTLEAMPAAACPDDEAVAIVTLHPDYMARSYYPEELLGAVGLRSVGSRSAIVKPEKSAGRASSREHPVALEIFAAGKRERFRDWSLSIRGWGEERAGASELVHLETIYAERAEDRLSVAEDAPLFEAVLHADETRTNIIAAFGLFVEQFGGQALLDDRVTVGGLCYVPISVRSSTLIDVAAFAYLRRLRAMPELRSFAMGQGGPDDGPLTTLPDVDAVNQTIRVAIFDAGLPAEPDLSRWVSHTDLTGGPPNEPNFSAHGLAVTSAALFGPLKPGTVQSTPAALIDHYKVIGGRDRDPKLYRVLERIIATLTTKSYDFVNLSLGPKIAITDDVIDVWTARLDEFFADGTALAFVAVGNDGLESPPANRVQPPSDGVNCLSIGASDSQSARWDRAPYSCIGPGRSPGIIKPDVLAFGGSLPQEPFQVLEPQETWVSRDSEGTSLASPYGMRLAIETAARFGHALPPLAMKALLIHHASRRNAHAVPEVGWGRLPAEHETLTQCEADCVNVVYKGRLRPGKVLRAAIPVPASFRNGSVKITVTICYASDVEPENPASYTRAGLHVIFRPNAFKRTDPNALHADSSEFFSSRDYRATEALQRDDAMKWETVLHKSKRINDASSLDEPTLDIHYVARESGAKPSRPRNVPYGMIVSVRQEGNIQLFDDVVARYQTLEVLRPRIELPISVHSKSE